MTIRNAFRAAVAAVLGMTPMSLLAQDLWTQKADMPTARFGLSATVVDGKVYAIGGGVYRGGMVRTVEEYDPATNSWVEKADMPAATCWHSTSAVDGKIYSIGGWKSADDVGIDTVVEYDPATDTWRERAEMPTPRAHVSTSAVNGKIYAIGGLDLGEHALATVEEYDPSTNTWTTKADMPTPRGSMSTSVVDGIIYAIGGAEWVHEQNSTVEAYDPATDTWTTKAPMPSARAFFSTTVVNGKIYAVGGCRGNYDLLTSNSVEVYDPVTDTWAATDPLPTPRAALATSTVNGRIYAIGGDLEAFLWWNPASLVEELTVAPSEYPHVYWQEVAASLAGSHGSQWATDLVLFNEAETESNISFILHGDDGQYTASATVVAGAQGVFEDVVGGTLGIEGKGLLEVRSSNPLRGAARIYNLADEGTFGQGFALHAAEEGLTAGDTAWLLELRQQRNRYRTNIAVANTGDVDAQVRISLLATDGNELHAFTLDLEPGELIQDIEPFAKRAGRPNLGWGLARAEVITGSGVLVSASVVDSRTNDATTVTMQR
jgi:N-acetylneuraminic acid mutarotase